MAWRVPEKRVADDPPPASPGCFDDPQTELDKFCCDPLSVVVDETTTQYYRRLCAARQETHDYWQELLDKFGNALVNLPGNFILSILSPEGLEMLGLTLGIDLAGTVAMNAMLRAIAVGVSADVMEAAAALAAKEGALWVNNAILSSVLSNAVREGSVAAIAFRLTRMLGSAVSQVANVLAIVQLLSAVLDAWDPKGYGQELNATAMEALAHEFDAAFRAAFLTQVPIGSDEQGRPIYAESWPVEYTVPPQSDESSRRLSLKTRLHAQGDELWTYVVEYLGALRYNSDGYLIDRGPDEGTLIAPDWGAVADQLFLQWTSGNTVAAAYLHDKGRRLVGWVAVAFFGLFLLAAASSSS